MENLKTNPLEELPAEYGGNCYSIPIDGPPKLNEVPELNGKIGVKVMYRSGKDYDYSKEPLSHEKTGKFIVLHMMFIIMFLELLVYCYIKYRNRLYIYIYI